MVVVTIASPPERDIADQHPPLAVHEEIAEEGVLDLISLDVFEDQSWAIQAVWIDGTGEDVPVLFAGSSIGSLTDWWTGQGPGGYIACCQQAKAACAITTNCTGVCFVQVIYDSLGSWSCGYTFKWGTQPCGPQPASMADLDQATLAWMN